MAKGSAGLFARARYDEILCSRDPAKAIAAAGLADNLIISITKLFSPDYQEVPIANATSTAEEVQKLAPRAKIVKAFNTLFAQLLQSQEMIGGHPTTAFLSPARTGKRTRPSKKLSSRAVSLRCYRSRAFSSPLGES
jgi:predicted dinucleotide-binding enzyme